MKTYELLQLLSEFDRTRLLLHMSLSETLNIAKDVDTNIYQEMTQAIVKLNDRLKIIKWGEKTSWK